MRITKKIIEARLNKQFKLEPQAGMRVKLISMDDPYTSLKEGAEGTIDHVDGMGQIHVNWDNGSRLALIPEEDQFTILNEDSFGIFDSDKKDTKIGRVNDYHYKQADLELSEEDKEAGMTEKDVKDDEPEEENPFEGEEERFRASIYVDVHIPKTGDLSVDKQRAKQVASELLKKMNHKDVSNVYLGGVAYNPYDDLAVDPEEFDKL